MGNLVICDHNCTEHEIISLLTLIAIIKQKLQRLKEIRSIKEEIKVNSLEFQQEIIPSLVETELSYLIDGSTSLKHQLHIGRRQISML